MDIVAIELSSNDFGQVVDGLEVLIEQWEATVRYLTEGYSDPEVPIREAHDADEARKIVSKYIAIRDSIEAQLMQQQNEK